MNAYLFLLFFVFSLISNQKAIIVGASTGIGREVVKTLARNHCDVGICSRQIDKLNSLKEECTSAQIFVRQLDLTLIETIEPTLQKLAKELGGLDLIVVNSGIWPDAQNGIMPPNKIFPFSQIQETIAVNVTGCTAALTFALNYFLKQNHGHIVGISSLDAVRGNSEAPTYCASKAFMSLFLEGIRNKCLQKHIPIAITEIRPGWIYTGGREEDYATAYWISPVTVAAHDIYNATITKPKVMYTPKRWAFIAFLLKITPDWIYNKLGGF
jgi:short-subunit dehydrogenase